MAYREVAMWEILNVLERVGRGESKAAVERVTGHTRKTIGRYVATAERLGWSPGEPITEELAAEVYRQHRPRSDRGPGDTEAVLLEHQGRIREWLEPGVNEKRGLRLSKVHQKLQRLGVVVPYSSLHRFAVKHCGFNEYRRRTVRLEECDPGQYAQVDFGRLGLVPAESGRRLLWALIVVLAFSRHQYVHATHSQKLPDLIDGLEDAWEFFGGVPELVIIDNMKAAVSKADRYDPVFQRTFEEYANYRGFVIDSARPEDPKGKPIVERGVPYVRENFFRGENWLGQDHVQREAIRWCLHTAGTRVHGTTRKRPLAVFENSEKALLKPLTQPRFDPPSWGEYKVHPDHHVNAGKALYSVASEHIGKRVWVRSDRRLVRIYWNGKLIKTHPRQEPGGKSTDYGDYPEEKTVYTMRDPQRLIDSAKEQGAELGVFMSNLLAGPTPWARLRQAQKLMRLGDKYGWARVEGACARANTFELRNVQRVENILLQDLDRAPVTEESLPAGPAEQPPLRFQRPADAFTHRGREQ
ncbi:MAG TPA: IS21 family transposase [Trueperaceae bacterium]